MNSETTEFDPIQFINKKFPTEDSLKNLDAEIDSLKEELKELNSQLIQDIHEHAILNTKLNNEIKKSQDATHTIVREVREIKKKAEQSEELVYEMCKDIKDLDIAKQNLTFSITALKKFVMMHTAIDKLREYCEDRKYNEVANLLLAFDELQAHFKKYENVSQLQELYKEKESIVRELKLQIQEDFANYGTGSSILSRENIAECCKTVESIGIQFKNQIVNQMCEKLLSPYIEIFNQTENASLEQTERRYGWLWRNVKEFDQKYAQVFPEYWGIHCHIVYEFCGQTRIQITDILEKKSRSMQLPVLMNALKTTLQFEQRVQENMKKQYQQYLGSKENSLFYINSLPRFKGSISDSFEPYLHPYVESEEDELKKNIYQSLQGDDIDQQSEIKVFNSSMYLFNWIKATLKRASQYSRSQTMFDIFKCIRRSLKLYIEELKQRIQKEDKTKSKDEQGFYSVVCFVINTSEYCKDTLDGLKENIAQNLDSPFSEKVELDLENELFMGLINFGFENLINYLEQKIEQDFQEMHKLNWDKIDVGDISLYVKLVKKTLYTHVKIIRHFLNEIYFVYYLNKVVLMMNKLFLQNIYKLKKISDTGLQQLRLDLFELRQDLIGLAKQDGQDKPPQTYSNFVDKTLQNSESLLKLLGMPLEKFKESINNFFDNPTPQDIEKLYILRGYKIQK